MALLNLVLWQPEIPPNTGNVARLAAALQLPLHLVGPLGFFLTDRHLRLAGLDYWQHVALHTYANPEAFFATHAGVSSWYFTRFATKTFWQASYQSGDFLFFGSETSGLPQELTDASPDQCLRIPHHTTVRSLNLSNCVAIAAYEALRQLAP